MDIADIIIFILFVVGGAAVSWWNGRKEKKGVPPYLEEPFPKNPAKPSPRGNPDFDELMEALGRIPKKAEAGESKLPRSAPPPLPPSKPVIPAPRPVAAPTAYVPRANPEAVTYESITSHDEDLNKRFAQFSSFDVENALTTAKLPVPVLIASKASQQNRWRQDLRSRQTLRKAFVLNEILQPPLALR